MTPSSTLRVVGTPASQQSVDAFLAGADVVASAVASDQVAAAWDSPSVLEGQTVGSLAGHLARGGVWLVGEFIAAGEPQTAVTYATAAAYFAAFVDRQSPELHQAIRDRGAAVAADGHDAIAARAREHLEQLHRDLPSLPTDRLISVIDGAVMRLADYLETRVVEQAVHLDDLGRSLGCRWELPEHCVEIATRVGVDIARRRHGDDAALRGLYRHGFAHIFPVL